MDMPGLLNWVKNPRSTAAEDSTEAAVFVNCRDRMVENTEDARVMAIYSVVTVIIFSINLMFVLKMTSFYWSSLSIKATWITVSCFGASAVLAALCVAVIAVSCKYLFRYFVQEPVCVFAAKHFLNKSVQTICCTDQAESVKNYNNARACIKHIKLDVVKLDELTASIILIGGILRSAESLNRERVKNLLSNAGTALTTEAVYRRILFSQIFNKIESPLIENPVDPFLDIERSFLHLKAQTFVECSKNSVELVAVKNILKYFFDSHVNRSYHPISNWVYPYLADRSVQTAAKNLGPRLYYFGESWQVTELAILEECVTSFIDRGLFHDAFVILFGNFSGYDRYFYLTVRSLLKICSVCDTRLPNITLSSLNKIFCDAWAVVTKIRCFPTQPSTSIVSFCKWLVHVAVETTGNQNKIREQYTYACCEKWNTEQNLITDPQEYPSIRKALFGDFSGMILVF